MTKGKISSKKKTTKRKKGKKRSSFPFKTIFFLIFFILFTLIAIKVGEKKIPRVIDYTHLVLDTNNKIHDLIYESKIERRDITEYFERKEDQKENIIFTNLKINFNDAKRKNEFYSRLIQIVNKNKVKVFNVAKYNLDGQETTTLYLGVGKFITHFIALNLIKNNEFTPMPVIAIVIDDMGYKAGKNLDELVSIEGVTFSVLPDGKYTQEVCKRGGETGHEIILHMPMEPLNGDIKGYRLMILTSDSANDMEKKFNDAYTQIENIKGCNNHMGSRLTSTEPAIKKFLKIIKPYNIFFLDSRTSGSSNGYKVAKSMGINTISRDVFLDNEKELGYVLKQINKLIQISLKRGYAVGIGHFHPVTIEAIKKSKAELNALGIEIRPVSYIIENQYRLTKEDIKVESLPKHLKDEIYRKEKH